MKGCLLRLSLYLPILALFILLFSIREPFPTLEFNPEAGGMALAPVAAFFIWFALLYLLEVRHARADLDIALAATGHRPRDGERVVVCGTVEEHGQLLEAPFSGESCVGYHYIVQHNAGGRMGMVTDYEGCALVPFVIPGPLGPLGVLARPGKEIFYEIPFETLREGDAYARAEHYLQATDFGRPGGLFGGVCRREISDGPGSFRQDMKDEKPLDLRSCTLRQKVLHPGEKIHVAGLYSEAKQAIEPDPDSIMKPLHIVPGGEESLARKIRNKRRGAVISAVLGLIVVAIYIFAFLLNTP